MSKYTRAKIFTGKNKKVPIFVRFSTTGGGRASPDTVRDARGFAVKFFTEDGPYDITANNTPTFFIRDINFFTEMITAGRK